MKPQKCSHRTTCDTNEQTFYRLPLKEVEDFLFKKLEPLFPEIKDKQMNIEYIQPAMDNVIILFYHKNKIQGEYERINAKELFSISIKLSDLTNWLNLPDNIISVHLIEEVKKDKIKLIHFNNRLDVTGNAFYSFGIGTPEGYSIKKLTEKKYAVKHHTGKEGYLLPLKEVEEKLINHLSKTITELKIGKDKLKFIYFDAQNKADICFYTQQVEEKGGIFLFSEPTKVATIRISMDELCKILDLPEPIACCTIYECIKDNKAYPLQIEYLTIKRDQAYLLMVTKQAEEYPIKVIK